MQSCLASWHWSSWHYICLCYQWQSSLMRQVWFPRYSILWQFVIDWRQVNKIVAKENYILYFDCCLHVRLAYFTTDLTWQVKLVTRKRTNSNPHKTLIQKINCLYIILIKMFQLIYNMMTVPHKVREHSHFDTQ